MKTRFAALFAVCALLIGGSLHAQELISHGRFKDVRLYRPSGDVQQFVLLLSGDNGWEKPVTDVATMLAQRGAMVAGIDVTQLFAELEADADRCVFADGDLENLAHYLQGYARVPTYHTPVLIGYSSGATLAYAMIAQASAGTFAGALSLGFCAELSLEKPLCRGEGLDLKPGASGFDLVPSKRLQARWLALQGSHDEVCSTAAARNFVSQVPDATFIELPGVTHDFTAASPWQTQFIAAYSQLTAGRTSTLPSPPASLSDLPLIEVHATGAASDTFAVLLSGDGGWAGLDKNVAASLAARGVAVVGLDSLRYFWSARTPQGVADDVDRVLRYYAAHWKRSRALLIGYSQGADVLPFAVNRLPAASKRLVMQTVLLGLGERASFEFHLGNWLGSDADGLAILPEVTKLDARTTLCLYGAEDGDSICPRLPATNARSRSLPGGHHFDGAYDELAALILRQTASQP